MSSVLTESVVSDSADMFQIGGGVTVDGREIAAGARVSYGASNKNTVYRGGRLDFKKDSVPNPV